MSDQPLPLLNVYDVPDEAGRVRQILAFIEPARADAAGIDKRSIVGEVTTTPEGGFDATGLQVNPDFVVALSDYMDEVAAVSPEMVAMARSVRPGWAYVTDPRNPGQAGVDPPQADIVGAFAVDDAGQISPGSFQYNHSHVLIDRDRGMSGLFSDRKFYDWLHRDPSDP